MSDDAPRRPKTVPGFGYSQQPLPPLEVQSVSFDEPTVIDAEGTVPAHLRDLPSGGLSGVGHAELPSQPVSAVSGGEGVPRTFPKGPPAVDVDLIYEHRTAPLPDQPWCFLEIWTRNTIYQLDAALICIDVIDQGTRRSIVDHPLRGARLVGGQSREAEGMELSHPFPRPGSEAVFEQSAGRHARFSQTSTVIRVVMRLRVLRVEPEQILPTWEDVSGKWERASGKPHR